MQNRIRIPKLPDGSYALKSFPGLEANPDLCRAALDVQYGLMPPPGKFNVHHHEYYSAKAYAAAGATSFTFFDQAPQKFVESLPQQGQINDDQFFWIDGISFEIIPNVTIAALAQTTPQTTAIAGYVSNATIIPAGAADAAQMACIYKLGVVNLRVGSRQIIEDAWGLQSFAPGAGPVVSGAGFGTVAATNYANASTNNGVQGRDAGWSMGPDAWLTKGRSITCSVDFRTAIALNAAGVIIARLHGTRITTGNV